MTKEQIVPAILSSRVRAHFRNWAATSTVGAIHRMWQSEGFTASTNPGSEQGERRTVWRSYEDSVDWANERDVRQALRVIETLVVHDDERSLAQHQSVLRQDGWKLNGDNRLVRTNGRLGELSGLASLRDPSGILDACDRASVLSSTNPAGCIGAAKDLIEATAKTVLDELGEPWSDDDTLPNLVSRVQRTLSLHPATVAAGETEEAAKKILGGLSGIALGVNLLRNRVGSGHGRATAPKLGERHARLAIGAAWTWCELVLDTLADPTAPWRGARATR